MLIFNLNPHPSSSEQHENTYAPLGLTMVYLLAGLRIAGRYARGRASVTGAVQIRARLKADIQDAYEAGLGMHGGQGYVLGTETTAAYGEATVFIDDIADEGPSLVAATALLGDQLANGFGAPETGLFTADGRMPASQWAGHTDVTPWARRIGVLTE